MSNESVKPVEDTVITVEWDELVKLALKDKGITEGYYISSPNFEIGSILDGPGPGIALAVTGMVLKLTDVNEPKAVDASTLKPKRKPRTSKKAE